MALDSYSNLKTAIANFSHRSDLTSYLDDFIDLAEARFKGDPNPVDPSILPGIRCKGMFKRYTASPSTEYFDLPTNLLEIKRLTIQGNTDYTLQYMEPWLLQEKYPGNTTGTPKHYTIIGDELQVKPIFSSASTVELDCYVFLDALSDANTSNWLLTYHPNIYLYACLLELGIFLEDAGMESKYASLYRSAAISLNRAEKRSQSGSKLISRVSKTTP